MYSKVPALASARVTQRVAWTRSFSKLLNLLSVGALSQQLPLRLMEQVMPYAKGFS